MKRIEKIPEYSMEVRFYDNAIHCYDLISEEIVASKTHKNKIKSVQKVSFNLFQLLDKNSAVIKYVSIDLASERSRVMTNAQYIFDIHMDTPNHGFYFGTYEIGEFSLLEDIRLKVDRSYPLSLLTEREICQRPIN